MKTFGKLLDDSGVASLFFLVTLLVYAASTAPVGLLGHERQSTAIHFSYLAESFLNGRLDLAVTPEEVKSLTELVPHQGKYYVVYPPMPAVLLMPLVAVFGKTFPTQWVSIFIAAISVALLYVALRRAAFSREISAWVTVLFGFGTTFWYSSLGGGSWGLAQTAAVFFLVAALAETYGPRRPWLVGLLVGAATLCRLPVVMATPFFLYVFIRRQEREIRDACLMLLGIGLFCGANALYNWIRYKSVLDVGYYLIPGVLEEPWYHEGILNIRYLPRNIYALFFQPPVLVDHFPYIVPSTFGLALLFSTPAFLLILDTPLDRTTFAIFLVALLVATPALLHGWPGATQFGYRFSLDYTPFLLLLTARALGGHITAKARLLIVLSCLLSLWGLRYATWIPTQWLFDVEAVWSQQS